MSPRAQLVIPDNGLYNIITHSLSDCASMSMTDQTVVFHESFMIDSIIRLGQIDYIWSSIRPRGMVHRGGLILYSLDDDV